MHHQWNPLFVGVGVESGCSAAWQQAAADLVGRLRDDSADSPAPQMGAEAHEEYARSARTARCRVRGLPGPLRGCGHHGVGGGCITGLARSDRTD
jgi:hypothetical protein